MSPRLLAISGPLKGKEFPIAASGLNIGRGPRNHVCLDDPLISVKHCSIWFEGNRCRVQDCKSEHATFVNEFSYTRESEAFQKSLFERVIRESVGNRAEAARRLGWHPNSFRRRCNELGIT